MFYFCFHLYCLQQLLIALNELEALKPTVKQKVDQLEKTPVHEVIGQNYNAHAIENHSMSSSVQYPIKSQVLSNNQIVKVHFCFYHFCGEVTGL